MTVKTKLLKLIGFKEKNKRDLEFKWGTISLIPGLEFSIGCCGDDGETTKSNLIFHLFYFRFFIHLWKGSNWNHDDMWESYGILLYDVDFPASIHINYGKKYKIIDLPWSWRLFKDEVLNSKGEFEESVNSWDAKDKNPDDRRI